MKGWIIKDGKLVFDENLRKPKIKKGWALVKVKVASLCGSDLGIIGGKMDVFNEGIVLGHEFAGTVENYDPSWKKNVNFKRKIISTIEIGQKVAINPYIPCYKCRHCKAGRTNLCEKIKIIGAHFHGGFGEYSLVPIENLIPIYGLPFKYACLVQPVACALSAVSKINLETLENKKNLDSRRRSDGTVYRTYC